MKTRRVSRIVAMSAFAIVGLYDIIPALSPEAGDTVSEIIAIHGARHPTIPFAFGVLFSHFTWVGKPVLFSTTVRYLWLPYTFAVVFDCFGLIPSIPMILASAAGIFAGRLLWAQKSQNIK